MMAALADLKIVVQLLGIDQLAASRALGPHIIGDLLAVIALGRREVLRCPAEELFHLLLSDLKAALLYHTAVVYCRNN
jgi:hypothetical protein